MTTTAVLGIPLVSAQQAQPEITHNEALTMISALLSGVVSVGNTTPPVSPAEGDSYVLGAAPTGAWAGRGKTVAVYTTGGWRFVPDRDSAGTIITMGAAQAGMRVYLRAGAEYYFDGTNWNDEELSPTAVTSYVSGVISGCEYTAAAGGSVFSIAAGVLRFIDDYTTPGLPVVSLYSFAGVTGVSDAYPTSGVTYIGINSGGTVVQQVYPFTPDEYRSTVPVCVLAKASTNLILASASSVRTAYNGNWFGHDLGDALGAVVAGCRYTGIAGLQFARGAGSMFRTGAHYQTDKKTPNAVDLTAQSPAQFAIYSRNSSNTVFTNSAILTTIDPTKYDNGGASTAGIPTGTVTTNNWQAIRLYVSTNGYTLAQYGTAVYNSADSARNGVSSETYYPAPVLGLVPFRGYLLVRGGATNLNAVADAVFLDAGKLGDMAVAAPGGAFAGTLSATILPVVDNTYNLGSGALRMATIYAATGTINTSDQREKTPLRPLTYDEIEASKDIAEQIGVFQFLAAVAEKGEAARSHIGLAAQAVHDTLERYGVDPWSYGFLCRDEIDGGYRLGLRYDELLVFMARGFDARLRAIEER